MEEGIKGNKNLISLSSLLIFFKLSYTRNQKKPEDKAGFGASWDREQNGKAYGYKRGLQYIYTGAIKVLCINELIEKSSRTH